MQYFVQQSGNMKTLADVLWLWIIERSNEVFPPIWRHLQSSQNQVCLKKAVMAVKHCTVKSNTPQRQELSILK